MMSLADELKARLPHRLGRWATELAAIKNLTGVDPWVFAALVDRESLGGEALSPRGPGGTGDGGNGMGLGQIDQRYHPTFIAAEGPDGQPLWKSARWNLLYCAELLSMNLAKFGGDYLPALAAYNARLDHVKDALARVPDGATLEVKAGILDQVTTGKGYVSDILTRRDKFLSTDTTQAVQPKEEVNG